MVRSIRIGRKACRNDLMPRQQGIRISVCLPVTGLPPVSVKYVYRTLRFRALDRTISYAPTTYLTSAQLPPLSPGKANAQSFRGHQYPPGRIVCSDACNKHDTEVRCYRPMHGEVQDRLNVLKHYDMIQFLGRRFDMAIPMSTVMDARTRIFMVSAGAFIVAIAAATGAGSSDSQDTHEPASERRVLHGLLEPSETATVGMLAEGILLANSAKEGDVVHEGDVIARLESAVESVALRMSEIQGASTQQIRLAQKRLELAQIEFKRFTDLIRENAAAEHELVTARLQAEAAEINVAIAKENHELARLRAERDRAMFERRFLRSPIDGQVIKRHRQPGELVHNLNPLVFDIAKLDPIRVRVDCPSDLIHETSVGDRALIYAPRLPKEGLAARITFVSPVLDAASDTFLVHIEVPNPEGKLVAGTRLSVELVR